MQPNKVSKEECIESLKQAHDILGESPSVGQYKELDITPSNITIMKRFGSWNEAKEAAELDTEKSPQEIYEEGPPENMNYTEKEWKSFRRAKRCTLRVQSKIANIKLECGCSNCGYDNYPTALDFHHTGDNKKEGVAKLVSKGAYEEARDEIKKCEVLCANCHRVKENEDTYDL